MGHIDVCALEAAAPKQVLMDDIGKFSSGPQKSSSALWTAKREFPRIGGVLLWGPYMTDPVVLGPY